MSDPPPESLLPDAPASRKRGMPAWLRHWVIAFLVINVSSAVIDHLLEPESRERLRHANEVFVRSVEQVDPFRLARTYWNYVSYDVSPNLPGVPTIPTDPNDPIARAARELNQPHSAAEKAGRMAGRAIGGAFWVIVWACSTGGAVSIVVTVIAVALAYLLVTGGGEQEVTLFHILLVPFLGSFLVFLLLLLMRLAAVLFGGLLDAAQLLAAVNATMFGLFWRVGEHHATTSLIERLAGKHGGHTPGGSVPHE